MKYSYTIGGILLFIALLAVAAVFFFFTKDTDTTLGERIQNLFPAGSEDSGTGVTRQIQPEDLILVEEGDEGTLPVLRRINDASVVSNTIFVQDGEEVIRYIEQETGHIFDAQATSSNIVRVTNTTIPRLREVVWTGDGAFALLRYLSDDLDTIQTYLGEVVGGSDGEGSITGSFLPQNAAAVAARTDDAAFFYLRENGTTFSGIEVNAETGGAQTLFSTPLREWLPSYADRGTLYLTTKPSARVAGFLYRVNTNGTLRPVVQNVPGLTSNISPSGTYAVLSDSGQSTFNAYIRNLENDTQINLSPTTLPEKCTWGSEETFAYCLVPQDIERGTYPDDWYQGRVSFSDSVWEIDLESGSATHLLNLTEAAGESIDGIRPELSPSGRTLTFINKNDSSLWSLLLPERDADRGGE